ncbi:MAG: hypothetical protein C0459_14555 [Chitinophaga sp.]|jgi:predicted 3-demethylubiquinone-9 3-methyltransferase (glyoxalase superfamily)|nr:hypothetical protein [Chitinophaga sp.]
MVLQKITPFLWFDTEAEDAALFYVSVFKNASMGAVSHYPKEVPHVGGKVLVANFTIEGQNFSALNGGPIFKFTEAVSFSISCDSQQEIDYYWNSLTADGGQESQCGWLKDKFGLSWQVVPSKLGYYMSGGTPEQSSRVMSAFMQMKKFVIADLEKAFNQ